eukprot:CAMPEP_0118858564 /NCGR_PEP_ID=MMETSP1163-20130328/5183_1 /TAXON_ID=124430 /ORGANISM="Phaeomonas parva, Strain CCMP2877" /LENGTH=146 /DNA_ID=CAMNT_0006792031 /DNA_START=362 /DNA_END=802 /DNA_ORIENTATION=+
MMQRTTSAVVRAAATASRARPSLALQTMARARAQAAAATASAQVRALSTQELLGGQGSIYVEQYGEEVPVASLLSARPLDPEKKVFQIQLFDPYALSDVETALSREGLRIAAMDDASSTLLVDKPNVSWKAKGKFKRQWQARERRN